MHSHARIKSTYCLCDGSDDGTPMIQCDAGCQNWYHFRCIDLTREEAGDLSFYACSRCSEQGVRSVMQWEGPDAFEPALNSTGLTPPRDSSLPRAVHFEESPDEGDGSGDDYTSDSPVRVSRGKRRTIRQASSDASDSDLSPTGDLPKRIRRAGHARTPKASQSRKSSSTQDSTLQPPAKRSKTSESTSPQDDPVRKYCLGKLNEVICAIFAEYPNLIGMASAGSSPPLKEGQDSDPTQRASSFVSELEDCLYNRYPDVDKSGRLVAGAKYKERFRMLSFNLAKPDRNVLRQGIASGRITPLQLSVMSSADLANEQTKQEIQQAEQESLQHSILKKITAPRAKITHKGLEDIEDVNEGQPDSERQTEHDELMEREKAARLRLSIPSSAAVSGPKTMSPSAPETSPDSWPSGTPMEDGFGLDATRASPTAGRSEPVAPTPETFVDGLNLSDLIHIDEDVEDEPTTCQDETPLRGPSAGDPLQLNSTPPSVQQSPSQPPPTPSKRFSFDLNTLWSDGSARAHPHPEASNPPSDVVKMSKVEVDLPQLEMEDPDFDMLLEPETKIKDTGQASSSSQDVVLPTVWSGPINMPLDSQSPLTPLVTAHQIGGRAIDPDSPLWKILFPSREIRIDGRVAVESSSNYLLTTRLNVSKELIAVSFLPQCANDSPKFQELLDYLEKKKRHALVFPWGIQPSPHAPGKELYLVPLLEGQPLPEYVEMLDELKISGIRESAVLIGIFVLGKGKLDQSSLRPAGPIVSQSVSYNSPTLQRAPDATLQASSLAAEIASLTPEQISHMLRQLGQTLHSPGDVNATNAPLPSSTLTTRPAFGLQGHQPSLNYQDPQTGDTTPAFCQENSGILKPSRFSERGGRGRRRSQGDRDRQIRSPEQWVPDSGWGARSGGGGNSSEGPSNRGGWGQ